MQPELTGDFGKLMGWVDKFRRLRVRTNADTPHDAKVAREFGAEGIGLCRTEHMFFEADRIMAVREMILAADLEGRKKALAKILPMQKGRFHRHLPGDEGAAGHHPPARSAAARVPARRTDKEIEALAQDDEGAVQARSKHKVEFLHEFNPMLGHRGCRLGITFPEIYDMQVQAIMEAACELIKNEGLHDRPRDHDPAGRRGEGTGGAARERHPRLPRR